MTLEKQNSAPYLEKTVEKREVTAGFLVFSPMFSQVHERCLYDQIHQFFKTRFFEITMWPSQGFSILKMRCFGCEKKDAISS